ncbi:unnamed protein product [Symbiodinium sp. CCMP2456]|nr:unnamed protein product [Symbiodinium sp. CCMP2456]
MAPAPVPAPQTGAPGASPVPAPARPRVPKWKLPPKKSKDGVKLFTRWWPRKKKRSPKKKTTILKEFGLLRNIMIWIPWWVSCVLERLTSSASVALQLLLSTLIATELSGLDILSSRRTTSDIARPLGSARRLAALAYDSGLSLFLVLAALLRLLPLPAPGDDAMAVLRRLALLQSCLGAALHCSSVIRWPMPSCDYRVPPLLVLLAYFAQPWMNFACFLALLRPDDHKLAGGLLTDTAVMTLLMVFRIAIFGRYGRPRMPREPQSWTGRTRDALLLGFFVLGLDFLLLRNAWIERRRNWKYVFSLVVLLAPLPFWRQLLSFFREDESPRPKKVRHRGRLTREDVRADIYGKMRPGVPKVSDLPPDASKKIRARRAQQLAELHRREEAFTAPAELPVAALRAAKEAPARAGDAHAASPAQAAES